MKELSKDEAISLCSPLPFVLVSARDDQGRPRHLYCIHDSRLVSLDRAGDGNFELAFR